jgi:hypothetical protein
MNNWIIIVIIAVIAIVAVGCARPSQKQAQVSKEGPPHTPMTWVTADKNAVAAAVEIKSLLFADQSLDELLKGDKVKKDADPNDPWARMKHATILNHQGKKQEAAAELHAALAIPDLETRTKLWIWNGLRQLGEQPDPSDADKVLGFIVEVPTNGGIDTLAFYDDGSARYINYTSAMGIWEGLQEPELGLGRSVLTSAQRAVSEVPLIPHRSQATVKTLRITLLTMKGLRQGEVTKSSSAALNETFKASVRLLVALVELHERTARESH